MKAGLKDGDASVYALCLSLATHLRVSPPFGQLFPLPDFILAPLAAL